MEEYKMDYLEKCTLITLKNTSENDIRKLLDFLKTDLGKEILAVQKKLDPLFVKAAEEANMTLNEKLTPIFYPTSFE